MTAKELAAMLSGREVGHEITVTEKRLAADAGLVVLFGCSDDGMEFCGAIEDTVDCFGGGAAHLGKNCVFQLAGYERGDCPYFAADKCVAKTITAVWHDEGAPCWTYETDIPHETFDIYEDGEVWCVGIVFSVEDLT